MVEWQNRPLDTVYPVIFIDAIQVKIRDGQVANRPIYVAFAVTVEGRRDILGLWAGDGGEGAKYWFQVLTELRTGASGRAHPGLRRAEGLPDAMSSDWPPALVQTCVIHLLRTSFNYASRKDWALAKALNRSHRPDRGRGDGGSWSSPRSGTCYPAIVRLWENSWAESCRSWVSFRDPDRYIPTNAIEWLNARFRRAINARGHFPPSMPP